MKSKAIRFYIRIRNYYCGLLILSQLACVLLLEWYIPRIYGIYEQLEVIAAVIIISWVVSTLVILVKIYKTTLKIEKLRGV
jgi:hypothetical protein